MPLPPPRARRSVRPPGRQDITAHVDFSALADAARAGAALEVLGYATQAQFLVNCGITEVLGEANAENALRYAPIAAQAQKLLSPAEMGELFKVLAVGQRRDARRCSGFSRGDRSLMRSSALSSSAVLLVGSHADEVADARKRWAESPHGPMLERILPPTFERRSCPEPSSRGAQLDARATACSATTCQSGDASRREDGPAIVERMVPRMEGTGNLGKLMTEMMAGVQAPSDEETRTLDRLPAQATRRSRSIRARYPRSIARGRGLPPRLQPVPRAARPAAPHRRRMAARWWRACRKTWSG